MTLLRGVGPVSVFSGAAGRIFAVGIVSSVLLSVSLFLLGMPKFAADGITKQAVLSLMILLCVAAASTPFMRGSGLGLGELVSGARPVVGVTSALVFVGVSSAVGNWTNVIGVVEDISPFILFISTFLLSARPNGVRPELLVLAGVAVGLAEVLVTTIAPFYVLSVPACFAVCVSKLQIRYRVSCGTVALIWLVRSVEQERLAQSAYGALVLSLAVSLLFSPKVRSWIVVTASIVVLVYAFSSLTSLFSSLGIGGESGVFEKVDCQTCLSHRVYEADAVKKANSSSAEWAIGQGFGGTIDLSESPDAETLASAGRDLTAVDDAHLFFYHYYLKVGLIGLVLLVSLLGLLMVRSCYFLMALRRPRSMEEVGVVSALLLVLTAPVESFGASTHLFTNPVFGIAAGLVVVRSARRSRMQAFRRERVEGQRHALA